MLTTTVMNKLVALILRTSTSTHMTFFLCFFHLPTLFSRAGAAGRRKNAPDCLLQSVVHGVEDANWNAEMRCQDMRLGLIDDGGEQVCEHFEKEGSLAFLLVRASQKLRICTHSLTWMGRYRYRYR